MVVQYDSRNPDYENFEFNLGPYKSSQIFVAKDVMDTDKIIFVVIENQNNPKDNYQFTYYSANYEKNSNIRREVEVGWIYLSNSDKLCELESANYVLNNDVYERFTKQLATFRSGIKGEIANKFKIIFDEPISLDQKTITRVRENEYKKKTVKKTEETSKESESKK